MTLLKDNWKLDWNPKPLLEIEEIKANQPMIINSEGIIMTKRKEKRKTRIKQCKK